MSRYIRVSFFFGLKNNVTYVSVYEKEKVGNIIGRIAKRYSDCFRNEYEKENFKNNSLFIRNSWSKNKKIFNRETYSRNDYIFFQTHETKTTKTFTIISEKQTRCIVHFNSVTRLILGLPFSSFSFFIAEEQTVLDLLLKIKHDLNIERTDNRFRLFGNYSNKAKELDTESKIRSFQKRNINNDFFHLQGAEIPSVISLFGVKKEGFLNVEIDSSIYLRKVFICLKENFLFFYKKQSFFFFQPKVNFSISKINLCTLLFCGRNNKRQFFFEIRQNKKVYKMISYNRDYLIDWYKIIRDCGNCNELRDIEIFTQDENSLDLQNKFYWSVSLEVEGLEMTKIESDYKQKVLKDVEEKYDFLVENINELFDYIKSRKKNRNSYFYLYEITKKLSFSILVFLIQTVCLNRKGYVETSIEMLSDAYIYYNFFKEIGEEDRPEIKKLNTSFLQEVCDVFFCIGMTYKSFFINSVYYSGQSEAIESEKQKLYDFIVKNIHYESFYMKDNLIETKYLQKKYLEQCEKEFCEKYVSEVRLFESDSSIEQKGCLLVKDKNNSLFKDEISYKEQVDNENALIE